jgi:hypothetical protein
VHYLAYCAQKDKPVIDRTDVITRSSHPLMVLVPGEQCRVEDDANVATLKNTIKSNSMAKHTKPIAYRSPGTYF